MNTHTHMCVYTYTITLTHRCQRVMKTSIKFNAQQRCSCTNVLALHSCARCKHHFSQTYCMHQSHWHGTSHASEYFHTCCIQQKSLAKCLFSNHHCNDDTMALVSENEAKLCQPAIDRHIVASKILPNTLKSWRRGFRTILSGWRPGFDSRLRHLAVSFQEGFL